MDQVAPRRRLTARLQRERPLAKRLADAPTAEVLLLTTDFPCCSTPDGDLLVLGDTGVSRVSWQNGKPTIRPVAGVPETAEYLDFSPDGRWLAYTVMESGRAQAYVQPYPGPGPRTPVTGLRSMAPAWRKDGRALFLVLRQGEPPIPGRGRMVEVPFRPGNPPRFGAPVTLFEIDFRDLIFNAIWVRGYDVSADGRTFYVVQRKGSVPSPRATNINVWLNWRDDLAAIGNGPTRGSLPAKAR